MKKKLVLGLVLAIAVAGSAFAQQSGEISGGARLGVALGFHDTADILDTLGISGIGISDEGLSNFNFAVYGYYTIKDNLSIQAELNFMIGQGYKLKAGGASVDITYNSLDIPILLKYSFLNEPIIFGGFAGPHLSFPIGQVETSGGGLSVKSDAGGVALGLTLGAYAGYPVGSGRIVGDLRFLLDFNATQIKEGGISADFIKRRALALTVGYEISI